MCDFGKKDKRDCDTRLPTREIEASGSFGVDFFLFCRHCVFGFCVWSSFCYAVLSVLSSFANILMTKREPFALLYLPSRCYVTVMYCVLGLQCMIVVFCSHTKLLLAKADKRPKRAFALMYTLRMKASLTQTWLLKITMRTFFKYGLLHMR